MKPPQNRFLLVYSSQTGQAKAIAEEIAEKAQEHGLTADLNCVSMTEKKFWLDRESCAVIITSTTGDGDPPDTAQKFWRRLKKKTLSSTHLSHLSYALLGLGDSNYTNFCNCGKMFDKRLEELGAKRFLLAAWADDATGLETVVDPWMDDLWLALRKQLGLTEDSDRKSDTKDHCNMTDNGEVGANIGADLKKEDILNNCEGTSQSVPVTLQRSTECSNDTDSPVDNPKSSVELNSDNVSGLDERTTVSNPKIKSNNTSLENNEQYTNGVISEERTLDKGNIVIDQDKTQAVLNGKDEETTHEQSTQGPPCEKSTTEQEKPSLVYSVSPLSESTLTVPALPAAYLQVHFMEGETLDLASVPLQNNCTFPSAASSVHMATVDSASRLTADGSVKTTLKIDLDIQGSGICYQPGDSFSIVCSNPTKEVEFLINRLGLDDKADIPFTMTVREGTKKRNASVPPYLPQPCTLRHALSTCLDIRSPPKKGFLRALVEVTSVASEKRRLQELCSKQGAVDYTSFIREHAVSISDILTAFPSCSPSVDMLIEHLPRLQPRPYSASSSPLKHEGKVQFAFNIIEIPGGAGRNHSRRGVCTGWLAGVTEGLWGAPLDVTTKISSLSLSDVKIPVFARTNQHFRLPEDHGIPIVLIGPGTGVAPFIGFLQHREALREQAGVMLGESWLFFGCRHRNKDFIFREEMQKYESSGILTHLVVSFSREGQDSSAPRYVQDNLALHKSTMAELLTDKGAHVYVCGDAKNMAKDVLAAFSYILQQEKGMSQSDAEAYIMQMRLHRRYHEDVWT